MKINIGRFLNRERFTLECEIVTPMFLGNARQEAELRAAPFKGLLRYWWRVAEGFGKTPEQLYREESQLFGIAGEGENEGGKSRIAVFVSGSPSHYASGEFPKGASLHHPSVKNSKGKLVPVDSFLYLGYGPIKRGGRLEKEGKGAFKPGGRFKLELTVSGRQAVDMIGRVMALVGHFGAVGSRSRNGWGSFKIVDAGGLPLPSNGWAALTRRWTDYFVRDYPTGFGEDDLGKPLVWRTDPHKDWDSAMNDLARLYLKVRLALPFSGKGPHPAPEDRHVLGYPAGIRHAVADWGNSGRHGSALRLVVRKEPDGHRGYFLHLPHRFSHRMWPDDLERQQRIWRKVHNKLDELGLSRVRPEEVPL